MGTRIKIAVGMMLLLVSGFAMVHANDAPVKSVGKTIQPLRNVPVRMVSEKVDRGCCSLISR